MKHSRSNGESLLLRSLHSACTPIVVAVLTADAVTACNIAKKFKLNAYLPGKTDACSGSHFWIHSAISNPLAEVGLAFQFKCNIVSLLAGLSQPPQKTIGMMSATTIYSLFAAALLWAAIQCHCSAFVISHQRQHHRASTTLAESSDHNDSFATAALTTAAAVAQLRGKIMVVKYGGNAMTSTELKDMFCQDVAALQQLGIQVVVVHGGGPQINSMLEKLSVESRFEGGMRVSSKEVVDVAEMVLCGSVNKEISSKICSKGGRAIGLSGRDDSLLRCIKEENKDGFDLQFVGNVVNVNTAFLKDLLSMGVCPVISPIGTGMGHEIDVAYNINADAAAGRIAGELGADRVIFLTDIAGVLNKDKVLFPSLSVSKINELIEDETITGGMIPKVSYATSAVQLGVRGAFITDGRVPHALIKAVLGGGENMASGQGGTVVTM
jgi:acetylglutamate kinase